MKIDRRRMIQMSAAGAVLAGPMQGLVAGSAAAGGRKTGSYGPLTDVADKADGGIRLRLPEGFRYRSFGTVGSVMDDGHPTPSRHDGMAAFKGPKGKLTRLVRNHEVQDSGVPIGDPGLAYDPLATGGTTNLVVDRTGKHVESWVSLGGTLFNCAGGAMPWGSWVTCEETVNGPDVGPDFRGVGGPPGDPDNYPSPMEKKHGYIFEVSSRGRPGDQQEAVPIRAAGRFAHEACAWDNPTRALYMTEDNFAFPSGLYRYLPPNNARKDRRLADGGKLQMLRVVGEDCADMAFGRSVGDTFAVDWVTIDDPDPSFTGLPDNDTAIQAVGLQGFAKGAAKFSRIEGIIRHGRRMYFNCTQGGNPVPGEEIPFGYGDGRGQVYCLDLRHGTLTLLYESPSIEVLDLPDNITVTPRGSLLLCEDNTPDNYLRGLTRSGELFDFCQNVIPGGDEEFAGATFSRDGKTLYVNIQGSVGITFAIWGPWHKGPF